MKSKIRIPYGISFNFTNMLGEGRISLEEFERAFAEKGMLADKAIQEIRETGTAKNHLSKDGKPEHVYFPRMPYLKEGNPNTEESVARLYKFGRSLRAVDAVVFLGVGGSYLGNKVLFDVFGGPYWNVDSSIRQGQPKIYFSGNNVDPEDCNRLLFEIVHQTGKRRYALEQRKLRVMLVPISKSGTTLETIAAFLFFYQAFSKEPSIQLDIAVVTDLKAERENAPLLLLAEKYGWEKFDIKEGIGGRFSVMTDPGLVTLAALGADIEEFLLGARDMDEYCRNVQLSDNPALVNALLKHIGYAKGRTIEVFMPYSMRLKSLGEWYIQLLAESLGKRCDREGNTVYYGRTPIVAVGTTDMHAQTQQHQEGSLNKVVQFIEVDQPQDVAVISNPFEDVECLKKYDGMDIGNALKIALAANEAALASDNRYNARFVIPKLTEYYLGQFMYFLMLTVAYEGELADVDAYDQPGVEIYKRFMKAQLYK